MSICEPETEFMALDLPAEFDGLEGMIQADLEAIVSMITHRAHEKLFLTRREFRQLQATIWNNLTDAIHEAVEPLSIEGR